MARAFERIAVLDSKVRSVDRAEREIQNHDAALGGSARVQVVAVIKAVFETHTERERERER